MLVAKVCQLRFESIWFWRNVAKLKSLNINDAIIVCVSQKAVFLETSSLTPSLIELSNNLRLWTFTLRLKYLHNLATAFCCWTHIFGILKIFFWLLVGYVNHLQYQLIFYLFDVNVCIYRQVQHCSDSLQASRCQHFVPSSQVQALLAPGKTIRSSDSCSVTEILTEAKTYVLDLKMKSSPWK